METSQFRLRAKEAGVEGNGLSLVIEGGGVTHSLALEEGRQLRLEMGTYSRIKVSGNVEPDVTGILYHVESPGLLTFPGQNQWSSNGLAAHYGDMEWVTILADSLYTTISASLEELAPIQNYTGVIPSGTPRSISFGTVDMTPGSTSYSVFTTYQAYDDDEPYHWIEMGDSSLTPKGTDLINKGAFVSIPWDSVGFLGGLLEPMHKEISAQWLWLLSKPVGGGWRKLGIRPDSQNWVPRLGATGNPIIEGVGLPSTLAQARDLFAEPEIAELVEFEVLAPLTDFLVPLAEKALAGGVSEAEISGFSKAFLLPGDCLKVRAVFEVGTGRKVERFALRRVGGLSCLLCDVENASLEYVQFVDDPAVFDPLFVAAFTTLFAARLARAICGSEMQRIFGPVLV